MTALFLAFLAVALAMLAGREAMRLARLAQGGVSTPALLAVVAAAGIGACVAAAWLAGAFAELLSGGQQSWFVAAALVLAGLEVIFLDAPKAPREPTQSLGAVAIVLFAGVLADASGMIVLSLSVATGEPWLVAAGGALAVIGVLGAAVIMGADWEKIPRLPLRWIVGLALLLSAGAVAFSSPAALG